MSIINNGLLLASGADAATTYQISRSLRFNSADSAYLSRTPGSAGNRKTWTWSGWAKRSGLGEYVRLFNNTASGTNAAIQFMDSDKLRLFDVGGGIDLQTTQVFRDASAWYHFVIVLDTTQATSSNRAKLYVNGSQITTFSTSTYPSQNTDGAINNNVAHQIGSLGGSSEFYNGYLADIHFIDGQALDPASFGEFDTNGVWQPKAFSGGSYGTNGFRLTFSDNSGTTATTLGKDAAGSNNWTPNNFSVASGSGNDSLVDTPTSFGTDTSAGGEVRGNYCTLNPFKKSSLNTLSNGNLDFTNTGAESKTLATFGLTSGKWYWECVQTSGPYGANGIAQQNCNLQTYIGNDAQSWGYLSNGGKYNAGASNSYGSSWTNNDVIGVAFDADAGKLWFSKNGTWQASGDPGAGTNAAFTGLINGPYFPAGCDYGATGFFNFGQRPFAYAAPSGFKALCDTNLPEGTITTSGTFTGNANADGPVVWLNGVPTVMTINGNAVTFGTHADKLANGFKLRSSSTSYNTAGSNTYSITTTGAKFKYARAQPNP